MKIFSLNLKKNLKWLQMRKLNFLSHSKCDTLTTCQLDYLESIVVSFVLDPPYFTSYSTERERNDLISLL